MKQGVIRIKKYAGRVQVVDDSNLSSRILNFLLGSLAIFALCYAYILGSMVFDIVERRALEAQARDLSNEVRELEITYLNESNKIDASFAEAMGFKEVVAEFATRKPVGLNSFGNLKKTNNEL